MGEISYYWPQHKSKTQVLASQSLQLQTMNVTWHIYNVILSLSVIHTYGTCVHINIYTYIYAYSWSGHKWYLRKTSLCFSLPPVIPPGLITSFIKVMNKAIILPKSCAVYFTAWTPGWHISGAPGWELGAVRSRCKSWTSRFTRKQEETQQF